ncbi:MAG: pantoate--beta-alanine ligase [Bdellovibrionota bacterium]
MSSAIKVFHKAQALREWRSTLANKRVGFVPTMGALHQGHATLLKKARLECETSVLSIFVNPTQFGPNEDLAKYPRTLERDLEIAKECGVDAVFAPTPDEIYPQGYSTFVEETEISKPLCGRFRPGHFRGVTTVVLKLFNLVQPTLSYFGLKDAQQFFVLNQMARDLNLPAQIVGVPTVREPDGLAMSSRNSYLSPQARETAPALYRCLTNLRALLQAKAPLGPTLEKAREDLNQLGFKVQYLDCVCLPDFKTADGPLDDSRSWLIALAAHLEKTRLIDNVFLWPEKLKESGIRIAES